MSDLDRPNRLGYNYLKAGDTFAGDPVGQAVKNATDALTLSEQNVRRIGSNMVYPSSRPDIVVFRNPSLYQGLKDGVTLESVIRDKQNFGDPRDSQFLEKISSDIYNRDGIIPQVMTAQRGIICVDTKTGNVEFGGSVTPVGNYWDYQSGPYFYNRNNESSLQLKGYTPSREPSIDQVTQAREEGMGIYAALHPEQKGPATTKAPSHKQQKSGNPPPPHH